MSMNDAIFGAPFVLAFVFFLVLVYDIFSGDGDGI